MAHSNRTSSTRRNTIFRPALLAGLTVILFGAPSARAEGAVRAEEGATAAALWNNVGCTSCHGDDEYYADKIKGALGKPRDQVARWIRDAPSVKPDTIMPSFKSVLTEADAQALAEWVQLRASRMP